MMKKEIIQPEGNYYDKYGSSNPIIKKIMEKFFEAMDELLETSEIYKLGGYCLEAGCGEGHVTEHIEKYLSEKGTGANLCAFDISQKLVEENMRRNPNIRFFEHNIYEPIDKGDLPAGECFDLIVCSEVLEHLDEPAKAVNNLRQYGDKFIFSVPHEPLWRILNLARGKYIRDLGNTPGHIQHFSSLEFVRMLESCGLDIIKIKKPLPWIMVYCELSVDS